MENGQLHGQTGCRTQNHPAHEQKHTHSHEHSHEQTHCCGCGHDHTHGQDTHAHGHGCCSHEHEHGAGRWVRIALAAAALLTVWILCRLVELPVWAQLLLYLVPYLTVGCDVLLHAGKNLLHGALLDEDFLMVLATVGALAIGFLPGAEPEFAEAVFVMLFFQVGEGFEGLAEDRSRRSIAQLMDIRPDSATVLRGGQAEAVAPEAVSVGEVILVKPGERVPLDGIVLAGSSALNTVALTGESAPRDIGPGQSIASGCVNLTGTLQIEVSRPYGESTVARILDLVENAGAQKSRSESLITSFARIYTPAVVAAAVLLALVPPMLSGAFFANFALWLRRALTFLVVSCPCALVVSVPLTFFAGIGGASARGILIKGSSYVEALDRADVVVFDKTGTLTQGIFAVSAIHSAGPDEKRLLSLAARAECQSTHPIAESLRSALSEEIPTDAADQVRELAGLGITARVDGHTVACGSEKLMRQLGAECRPCTHDGTIIHVAIDGVYAGHIVISDTLKEDAAAAVSGIRAAGVRKTVLLTGDRRAVGEAVGAALGIDEVHAELMPADKVRLVEQLIASQSSGRKVVFVGDGINDAPVLARADVGVAMGALGSDAAIEAADIVLMDDRPSRLALAKRICRRTRKIARQNIVFALAVKFAVLIFTALGYAPMALSVFADVGVMVLAVLNAMRALRVRAA